MFHIANREVLTMIKDLRSVLGARFTQTNSNSIFGYCRIYNVDAPKIGRHAKDGTFRQIETLKELKDLHSEVCASSTKEKIHE